MRLYRLHAPLRFNVNLPLPKVLNDLRIDVICQLFRCDGAAIYTGLTLN